MTTKGEHMFHELTDDLDINVHAPNKKRVCTNRSITYDNFDPQKDTFVFTTNMMKLLTTVVDCFKDNVTSNIRFTTKGMNIFALYACKTVCINAHLGADIFSNIQCEKDILIALNVVLFGKKLNTIYKFKIDRLTLTNSGDDLMLKGDSNNSQPINILMKSIIADVEELDLNEFKYDIYIRIPTSDFVKQLECMSGIFTIRLDITRGEIVLIDNDELSTTKVSIVLDKETKMKLQCKELCTNYECTFMKNNMTCIIRGQKLSEYITLGLSNELPLFVSYTIGEYQPENTQSSIDMYFSPRIDNTSDME